jgi:hypothetical protein
MVVLICLFFENKIVVLLFCCFIMKCFVILSFDVSFLKVCSSLLYEEFEMVLLLCSSLIFKVLFFCVVWRVWNGCSSLFFFVVLWFSKCCFTFVIGRVLNGRSSWFLVPFWNGCTLLFFFSLYGKCLSW